MAGSGRPASTASISAGAARGSTRPVGSAHRCRPAACGCPRTTPPQRRRQGRAPRASPGKRAGRHEARQHDGGGKHHRDARPPGDPATERSPGSRFPAIMLSVASRFSLPRAAYRRPGRIPASGRATMIRDAAIVIRGGRRRTAAAIQAVVKQQGSEGARGPPDARERACPAARTRRYAIAPARRARRSRDCGRCAWRHRGRYRRAGGTSTDTSPRR